MVEYQQDDPTSGVGPSSISASEHRSQPASATELPTSGLAIAGMVLGIIGAATSFMPIINNISFFLGIAGLILSIVGLVGVNKGRKKGRGFAIAGTVLNIIALVVVLASQAFYGSMLDSMSDSLRAKPAASTAASSEAGLSAPSGAAADSAFKVTIDEASQTTDYQGNPTVIVTFTFTNGSDRDTSFMGAVNAKAFQNGVQLDSAIGSSWDSSGAMKEVKTGGTVTVQEAFELVDSSPITVEVTKLFDLDNTLLAEATYNTL